MREIKFRGKNKNIGWVYGQLVYDENKNPYIVQNVEQDAGYSLEETMLYAVMWYRVIPETVGQYTGLKDKNGVEIYEGDIATGTKYPFIDIGKQNYIGIVVFYEDVAQFGYEYKCVNKYKRGISNGINNEFNANENLICEDLEVIGNIYDNPELLEGE